MNKIYLESKEFFEEQYIELKKSINQIKDEFGCSYKFVWSKLKQFDIKRRNKSETKLCNLNPNWKGNNVKYIGIHVWIRRHKPKVYFCERCNIPEDEVGFLDLANISGKYKRDIHDYEWLCRRCHMNEDNRILNLKQYNN